MRNAPLIALALVAACRSDPGVQKEPSMTTSKQILYYDGDRLIRKEDFAKVPEHIRYVEIDGRRVEVAKIVRKDAPNGQAIEQYGVDGLLLSRTLMIKTPPAGGKDGG